MGTAKSLKKEEIVNLISNLSYDELSKLQDFLEEIKKETENKITKQDEDVLDRDAFNYVLNNYGETIKGLVER